MADVDPDDHTVPELEDAIEDVEDVEALRSILEAERAGKDRKTAKAALERRIDAFLDR